MTTTATLPPLPQPPPGLIEHLNRHGFVSSSSSSSSSSSPAASSSRPSPFDPSAAYNRLIDAASSPYSSNLGLDLASEHFLAAAGTAEEALKSQGRARKRPGEVRAGEGEDEWEDVGEEGGGELDVDDGRPGRLVILSKHPAFVVAEVQSHAGVLVAIRRRKGDKGVVGVEDVALERMPLPTRIGMRLLFHGVQKGRLLRSKHVEEAFKHWSIRTGEKYDSPHHARERIEHFVESYCIDTTDLLLPSLTSYPTLNSFFYRKLRQDARPIARPGDPTVISSAADCRLTVFDSVESAKKLWIKGQHFTLPALLHDAPLSAALAGGSVAIFRLAPADYHRFHAPVDCTVGGTKHIAGGYLTVNSMIVRDKNFDVFTSNKRDVTTLHTLHPLTQQPLPVAYVQVGALLVASIRQTKKEGREVERGEELGYFAYGGSTIVAVFPKGTVQWDKDLLRNSTGRNDEGVKLETLVKVGEKIGRWVA
ncbi:hypothetical protein JCM6882_001957 [Rhodosporidiobolus microsporus]